MATSVSSLPQAAIQAANSTLATAMAEAKSNGQSANDSTSPKNGGNENGAGDLEDGEIQELDMEAQAEGIRTVFNDPTNFNVKVSFGVIAVIIFVLAVVN